jgi:hypothetical protein
MHLIDKHFFPKDYDFYVINDGIDRRSSMLRSGRHRRRSSAAQSITDNEERGKHRSWTSETISAGNRENTKLVEAETGHPAEVLSTTTLDTPEEDGEMEGLTGAMSSLKFVPPSVRFGRGRGKGRGGFSRS